MNDAERKLATKSYDFAEFGCGDGKSMLHAQKRFHVNRGLGIDLDPRKIDAARRAGCDVELGDVTALTGVDNSVRFVVMKHFLEHLPGREVARACITKAVAMSRHFVFIRGPWFDTDGYLFREGLKLYWSDWVGHGYHLTALDLVRILRPLTKVKRFVVFGVDPILESAHDSVLPLAAPAERGPYQPSDGPKPAVRFAQPVYREVACLVQIASDWKLDGWSQRLGWSERLYDSARQGLAHSAQPPQLG